MYLYRLAPIVVVSFLKRNNRSIPLHMTCQTRWHVNCPQWLWISWGSSSAKDCEFLQVVATTKVKAAVASSVDTFWLYDFLCWANPLHCRTQTEISLQSIFELSRCSIYYGTCLYGTTWPSAFVCVIFEASCSGKRFSILFICIVFFVSSRKA